MLSTYISVLVDILYMYEYCSLQLKIKEKNDDNNNIMIRIIKAATIIIDNKDKTDDNYDNIKKNYVIGNDKDKIIKLQQQQ